MKKNTFGRKLGRNVSQRAALFKGLMSSLVLYGHIKTTEAKAKSIKGEIDKLVTKSRKDAMLARKLLAPHLTAEALDKFILEVVPFFKDRKSGFTRTVRIGKRVKDNAPLVLLTWTDEVVIKSQKSDSKSETGKKVKAVKPSVISKTAKKTAPKKIIKKKEVKK